MTLTQRRVFSSFPAWGSRISTAVITVVSGIPGQVAQGPEGGRQAGQFWAMEAEMGQDNSKPSVPSFLF